MIYIPKEVLQLRLKAYRKKHGMRQEDLATKLHVAYTTVSRWERMIHKVSYAHFRLLQQEGIL